jgi:2-dehydro-3-deoxyphosphogluconate aldolase/(4S)-4-hydroxy-2-oxoglutarate aldolase
MITFEQKLARFNVVPVVTLNSIDHADALAKALIKAKLTCIEVTFRTKNARDCMHHIKQNYPEILLGAGTVLSTELAQDALDIDCDFAVSPALNPDVVKFCQDKDLPILPGICNPKQVEEGIALGLSILKFFPAEVFGGVKFLSAISSIYPVKFMPTGGISHQSWRDYLALDNVICCGGSWIASNELIKKGEWDTISELAVQTNSL